MSRDELKKRIARALCKDHYSRHGCPPGELEDAADRWAHDFIAPAEAALAEHESYLAECGLVVVPKEPTTEILSEIAAAYLAGATDRIAGNAQRAVPAARQAWSNAIAASQRKGES